MHTPSEIGTVTTCTCTWVPVVFSVNKGNVHVYSDCKILCSRNLKFVTSILYDSTSSVRQRWEELQPQARDPASPDRAVPGGGEHSYRLEDGTRPVGGDYYWGQSE